MNSRSVESEDTSNFMTAGGSQAQGENKLLTDFDIKDAGLKQAEIKSDLASLRRVNITPEQHQAITAALLQTPELIPSPSQYMQMQFGSKIPAGCPSDQLARDFLRFLKALKEPDTTLGFNDFARFSAGSLTVDMSDVEASGEAATGSRYNELFHQLKDAMQSGAHTFLLTNHPLLTDIPDDHKALDLHLLQALLGTEKTPVCISDRADEIIREFCNHIALLNTDSLPYEENGTGLFSLSAEVKSERILLEEILVRNKVTLTSTQKNKLIERFQTASEGLNQGPPDIQFQIRNALGQTQERLESTAGIYDVKPMIPDAYEVLQFHRHLETFCRVLDKDIDKAIESSCEIHAKEFLASDKEELKWNIETVEERLSFSENHHLWLNISTPEELYDTVWGGLEPVPRNDAILCDLKVIQLLCRHESAALFERELKSFISNLKMHAGLDAAEETVTHERISSVPTKVSQRLLQFYQPLPAGSETLSLDRPGLFSMVYRAAEQLEQEALLPEHGYLRIVLSDAEHSQPLPIAIPGDESSDLSRAAFSHMLQVATSKGAQSKGTEVALRAESQLLHYRQKLVSDMRHYSEKKNILDHIDPFQRNPLLSNLRRDELQVVLALYQLILRAIIQSNEPDVDSMISRYLDVLLTGNKEDISDMVVQGKQSMNDRAISFDKHQSCCIFKKLALKTEFLRSTGN